MKAKIKKIKLSSDKALTSTTSGAGEKMAAYFDFPPDSPYRLPSSYVVSSLRRKTIIKRVQFGQKASFLNSKWLPWHYSNIYLYSCGLYLNTDYNRARLTIKKVRCNKLATTLTKNTFKARMEKSYQF